MSIFFALYACMSVLMCKDTINSKPEIALSKNQKKFGVLAKTKRR